MSLLVFFNSLCNLIFVWSVTNISVWIYDVQSVAFDRTSAPKDCRVSAWFEGPDDNPSDRSKKMFPLTEFTYDLEKSNAQTFNVETNYPAVTNMVRLDFSSNHGSSSVTCIYRLRVHGYDPNSSTKMWWCNPEDEYRLEDVLFTTKSVSLHSPVHMEFLLAFLLIIYCSDIANLLIMWISPVPNSPRSSPGKWMPHVTQNWNRACYMRHDIRSSICLVFSLWFWREGWVRLEVFEHPLLSAWQVKGAFRH